MGIRQYFLPKILYFLLATSSLMAQDLGSFRPDIRHYDHTAFQADPQFWAIAEDSLGFVYFGNNDGVLAFDRARWQKVILPNNSGVRGLCITEDGKVYAGGYNEFGLVEIDSVGQFRYRSLLNTILEKEREFENIWQAHAVGNTAVFRSFKKLFVINDNQVAIIPAPSTFIRTYLFEGKIYVQDERTGIYEVNLAQLRLEMAFSIENGMEGGVSAILPHGKEGLAYGVSRRGKVFLMNFKSKELAYLGRFLDENTTNQVMCGMKMSSGRFLLGMLRSHALEIKLSEDAPPEILYEYDQLLDKTVLALHEDSHQNVWALLNHGIDYIRFNASQYSVFEGASIYDVLHLPDQTYVATNQGVYKSKNLGHAFEELRGLEGQVWSVQLMQNDVLVSHDRGLFTLSSGYPQKVEGTEGVWKVVPFKDNLYLACSYSGLYLIEKSTLGWKLKWKIEGFQESSRDIKRAGDEYSYWVCHGYKGVFRISLNPSASQVVSVVHYNEQHGLPSKYNINVHQWNQETVFSTNAGLFTFDPASARFLPHTKLNTIFGTQHNVRKIFNHENRTWFVHDDEIGYFFTEEEPPVLHKQLFAGNKGNYNRGMECIKPIAPNQVLVGTQKGLLFYDLSKSIADGANLPLIRQVRILDKDQEIRVPLVGSNTLVLPLNTQKISIDVATPRLEDIQGVLYEFILEGRGAGSSGWQSNPQIEYNYLPPGEYLLKVKSKPVGGVHNDEALLSFVIPAPWYRKPLAWVVYSLLGLALSLLIISEIKRFVKKERIRHRIQSDKEKKLLELELERYRLSHEKEEIEKSNEILEADVMYQSKELANYTMLLVKKRELISEIKEELMEIRRLAKVNSLQGKITDIIVKIKRNLNDEEHLKVFEASFDKVHQYFLKRLKELYPDLNGKDLRLCAFVKMNLSNKDIAPLINISVRGVETARYRLRKKFDLDTEANLTEFLASIDPSDKQEQEPMKIH